MKKKKDLKSVVDRIKKKYGKKYKKKLKHAVKKMKHTSKKKKTKKHKKTKCPLCDKTFESLRGVKIHTSKSHNKKWENIDGRKKRNVRKRSKKKAKNKPSKSKKKGKKRVNKGNHKFSCPLCDDEFSTLRGLKIHTSRSHNKKWDKIRGNKQSGKKKSGKKHKKKTKAKKQKRKKTKKKKSDEGVKTVIDELLDYVEKKGKVSTKDASHKFKVSENKIEEWANILEEGGLIKIDYPLMGKAILIKGDKDDSGKV